MKIYKSKTWQYEIIGINGNGILFEGILAPSLWK